MDELHKTLWTYYGYSSFRPGQERLIRALLEGNDVLGVMPTGATRSALSENGEFPLLSCMPP